MKLNKEKLKTNSTWILFILNCVIWYNLYQVAVPIGQAFMASPIKTIHITKQAKAQISLPEDEPTEMKAWIRWRISQTNISWKDYSCMVEHESGWNQYAINKNTNGTFDTGYLQINQVHKLPRECSFNYKCATEWAIEKIKKQGFNPWYGWRNNCQ